jgi:hypothetical protein
MNKITQICQISTKKSPQKKKNKQTSHNNSLVGLAIMEHVAEYIKGFLIFPYFHIYSIAKFG